MFDFSDQVVIVTGGSGNLGGAVVRAFHAAGASLVVPDRQADRLYALFPDLADSDPALPGRPGRRHSGQRGRAVGGGNIGALRPG